MTGLQLLLLDLALDLLEDSTSLIAVFDFALIEADLFEEFLPLWGNVLILWGTCLNETA